MNLMNKKSHSKYSTKNLNKSHLIQFGKIGFKSLGFQCLKKNELNTIEWLISKKIKKLHFKKKIKFWNLISLNLNLTKLSPESRMGKGKGFIYTQAIFIRPGIILFEFDNLTIWQSTILVNFLKKILSVNFVIVQKY